MKYTQIILIFSQIFVSAYCSQPSVSSTTTAAQDSTKKPSVRILGQYNPPPFFEKLEESMNNLVKLMAESIALQKKQLEEQQKQTLSLYWIEQHQRFVNTLIFLNQNPQQTSNAAATQYYQQQYYQYNPAQQTQPLASAQAQTISFIAQPLNVQQLPTLSNPTTMQPQAAISGTQYYPANSISASHTSTPSSTTANSPASILHSYNIATQSSS